MNSIDMVDEMFQGAISLERTHQGVKPWRIPYQQIELFPISGLGGKAESAAGVRLRFATDSVSIRLIVEPSEGNRGFDLVVDKQIVQSVVLPANEQVVEFDNLSRQQKTVEIYLPQAGVTTLTGLQLAADASYEIVPDQRPRWITYGSSITQCASAASPAETWPAIAARAHDLHLTCLGYGGNCHIEPMVARMIRDTPADLISLCLGINVYGQSSLSERTFRSMVIGFIETVRERHQDIPIIVVSPIFSAPREETENKVGLTLVKMRQEIEAALDSLRRLGVNNLHYLHGLDLLGAEYASYMPDHLHPDAAGYRIMGERFQRWLSEQSFPGICEADR